MSIAKLKMTKLGLIEFAKPLVTSRDLDPLYVALWEAQLTRKQLCKWLLAYWCYYHAGVSSWASEQSDFYGALEHIARSGTDYPRGSERRHFRGELAIRSVAALKERGSAEKIIDWLCTESKAYTVMARVKLMYGFGEWISWKVPDMLERLGMAPIRFEEDDVALMFKSSLEGAQMTYESYCHESTPESPLVWAHRYVLKRLPRMLAPPRFERVLNVQETETIFCKWKSHVGGHYPLGKDSHELRLGLLKYARSRTSQRLLAGLPTAHVSGKDEQI
jgi:hypothetical protein